MARHPSALKELDQDVKTQTREKNSEVLGNERKTQKPNVCNLSEKG